MKRFSISLLLLLLVCSVCFSSDLSALDRDFASARASANISRLKELANALEGSLKEESERFGILLRLGMVCYEIGVWSKDKDVKVSFFDKAIEYLKKAVEASPESYLAHYYLGASIGRKAQCVGILQSLFMLPEYDRHIKKAMELKPDFWLPYLAMGMRYREIPFLLGGNLRKSEELIKKAIELKPDYLSSYVELGLTYEAMKKFDLAKEVYRKVLEMDGDPLWKAYNEDAKARARKRLESLKK